jgi:hypothetical protein
MPWVCCGQMLVDSLRACPSCQGDKASWTVRVAKTRVFVLAKVWVAFELLDDRDEPVPDEPYRLEAPDGTVHVGALDERGCARVGLNARGRCRLWFPNLDERDWSREDDEPGPAPTTPGWVELALQDDRDEPVAGARYRLVDPAGDPHEGTLDGAGRARVAFDSVGACVVTFPDIDTRDWEVDPEGQAPAPDMPLGPAWVEVVVRDELDAPLADSPYRVLLPDGSVVEGRLDAEGRLRVEGLPAPGECVLTLTGLDASEHLQEAE